MTEEKILDRIRGLLAKAESSEFTEEAEVFLDKATELMAKHRITEALLASHGSSKEDPVERIFITLGKWHVAKSQLMVALCQTFDSHCIWAKSKGKKVIAIVGHRSDLDVIESLFVSLEIQLDRELLKVQGCDKGDTRSMRASFAYGFCSEVANRIEEHYSKSFKEEMENYSNEESSSVAIVLASREQNSSAKFEEFYHRKPSYRNSSYSGVSNYSAYSRGSNAGNKADIGRGGLRGGGNALNA